MTEGKRFQIIVFIILTLFILINTTYAAGENLEIKAAISQYNIENYEEAIEILQNISSKDIDASKIALYLGLSYQKTVDYNAARKELEKSISLNPNEGDAYIALAEVLISTSLQGDALKALSNGHKNADLSSPYFYFLKGTILLEMNKYDEAINEFAGAKRKADKKLIQKIYHSTGVAYLNSGKKEQAEKFFKKSISTLPQTDVARRSKIALNSLGYGKKKKYSLNVGYIYQIDDNVAVTPSNDDALKSLGSNIEELASNKSDSRHVAIVSGKYESNNNKKIGYSASYSFYQSKHKDLDSYDLQGHNVELVPVIHLKNGDIDLSFGYENYKLDKTKYLDILEFWPSYNFSLKNSGEATIFFGIQKKDFAATVSNVNENRDGTNVTAGAHMSREFSGNKGLYDLGYLFNSEEADGDNWDYKGHKLFATLSYSLKDNMGLFINSNYSVQKFENAHSIYTKTREDKILQLNPGFLYKYKTALITLEYSYTKDDSNLAVYEYNRGIYSLGLEYSF